MEAEDREQSIELCERWLSRKGAQLWADWSVTHPEGRRAAATWFIDQVADFAQFIEDTEGSL